MEFAEVLINRVPNWRLRADRRGGVHDFFSAS
jgi:hypothetical protein